MNKKIKKIIKFLVIDIIAYAVLMGVFLLIFYILPYELESDGTVVANDDKGVVFSLPSEDSEDETEKSTYTSSNTESSQTSKKTYNKDGGKNTGNTGTSSISSNTSEANEIKNSSVTETILEEYKDEDKYFTISKKEIGSSSDKITYYVVDLYVTSAKEVKTALAEDTYGNNIKDTVSSIMEDNDALLGITGDSYGNNDSGIVVRNGILYRDEMSDADICVLFTDGTMETYSADEFDSEKILAKGVYQAWSFGPSLLTEDGELPDSYNTTSYLTQSHPRVAIGYIEPGHYVLVAVDGRNVGYSKGATLSELSQIMKSENCVQAYNLDGGNSTGLIYNGSYINKPLEDREISDIIYIGKESE